MAESGSVSLFSLIVLTMASLLDGQTLGGPLHGKHVVCYVATWAAYRPAPGSYTIDDLEPGLCTHLVYAFAGLDETTNSIKSLDAWQDLERDFGKAGYKRMVALKERYPHLKVTIAIGGWNEGSAKYSKMAADKESRAKFIKSVLLFLDLYKFDGLDLDWEYPARRDGQPQDKANYVALVKELKDAFEPRGYILTAALGAGKETMEAAYDLTKLSRYLDLIHMMCYDYHGTWDSVVGANAPLSGSEEDELNVEYSIKYMLAHGVSPYKLVLGLPIYGRTFKLQNPDVKEIEFGRTPVKNVGFPGPFTKENGFMGYNEICRDIQHPASNWTHHWHAQSQTPYIRDGDRIIVYDNGRSIASKVKMAIDYGLGGFMAWSIDTDDFRGDCQLAEKDAFSDFVARAHKMADDPLLKKALQTLNLPDTQHRLGKRSYYSVSSNRLHLRVPEAEYSNYNIMRTINEAAAIALEEKRIADEMERISKENEIKKGNEPDSASGLGVSAVTVLACAFVAANF